MSESQSIDVDEFRERLDRLREEAVDAIAEASSEDEAIKAKNAYLGREGEVQELMGAIGDLPDDQRPEAGRAANTCKGAIEDRYEQRLDELERKKLEERIEREAVDVTLPARTPVRHGGHPIVETLDRLVDIFVEIGFEVATGPEVETDFYNFEALNFPEDHPARDMQDTFKMADGRLLRTHTSPVQIRTMEAYEPPIRIVSPGRVFRCDADLTHSPTFHQLEGLLIDRDVTLTDLKGTLRYFAEETFGRETDVRFRPSYFPFTEPSAELDIDCVFCGGSGCRVCGDSGWLEILGAGMVDPHVLEAVDFDPDVYSGYAFGLGVERVAMLNHDIDDIRYLFENDLRFLEQF
ncbi:MAG: phenylalanine--tRNA ligase subunit alpha [Bradymonadaceae bacterium]